MQLARQGKISLEEDSAATNAITIRSGHVNGNKDSCNAMHGDDVTSNGDTLFEKKDSSDADDCMSTIIFTYEDLLLGSKPHNRPLFVAGYGFMPSTQEEEEEHEALAIDEKGFDPKAFKLLIKVGYDPKEKLSLGKLPPEATGKKILENLSSIDLAPTEKEFHGTTNRQSIFDRVLNAKAQTVIFTQVQFDDEDDKESVASSNYISNGAEEDITRTYHITLIEDGEVEEEDTEDAPAELEEDATTSHEALSFMDGSSGYNQICMALADEELTAFRTPKGSYCYKVMPFGLKNADATYQSAMQRIFNDMLHKNIECYVDDLVLKSKKREDHFHDLRKYVMAKPVLSDRLVRWYLQLQQFEITYVPQKAVKGQVLADFLADHPMPAEWALSDDLLDEDVLVIEVTPSWKMYFDGACQKEGVGAGVVFVTLEAKVQPFSFTSTQNCSNNVAEYQALILGLEIAVDAKQLSLKVYGDSQLVVNQLLGLYEVKKP
ncbi:Retrovirus-related Pol polyprotein from transposon.6 [Sesamum angolense]|uniref:Retrovirus-related Pol polyprotein from transposon.6 n=1 Tax=Sesamum angolense TaxID=2727404 RepID=A0AAE1WJ94_9LAMI|nr:Retrovirus-related Pol polyprotein from transposon.6 [Sesamum angolense]